MMFSTKIAQGLSKRIHDKVMEVSKESQSNGSLMRLAPLPFFFGIFNRGSDYRQEKTFNKEMSLSKEVMKEFVKS
jgi:ADP-ribosylglycohydrolase